MFPLFTTPLTGDMTGSGSAFTSCSCAHGEGLRGVTPQPRKPAVSLFPIIPPPPPPPQQPRASQSTLLSAIAGASTSINPPVRVKTCSEWANDVAAARGDRGDPTHHHTQLAAPNHTREPASSAPTSVSAAKSSGTYPPTSPAKWYEDAAADARVQLPSIPTAATEDSPPPATPASNPELKRALEYDDDDHFGDVEPQPKRRSAPASPVGKLVRVLSRTSPNPPHAGVPTSSLTSPQEEARRHRTTAPAPRSRGSTKSPAASHYTNLAPLSSLPRNHQFHTTSTDKP
ncbi:uncharacterized protein EHS24_000389 [Apiotrichum porosum]|uniref:Uncharacterized protein n=1 Tax=Apiotrichum porosum TaxID=105984 RepID=A0A427Y9N6_9TREE|nr:uncharacterized protein EHS24_000389 [Apiotrichum porosum]RSH87871.1 hypothetical protein EHS24_000389 [Apiotrichum porosum]